jgi:hypothetical protein
MTLIIVTIALVALAFWQRNIGFLSILAGLVAIAFGAYWVTTYTGFLYVIEGVVMAAIGLYLLIDSAVKMIRG